MEENTFSSFLLEARVKYPEIIEAYISEPFLDIDDFFKLQFIFLLQ